jgi:fused signal recognition particle receptor
MLGWFKKKKKTDAEALPGSTGISSEEKQVADNDAGATALESIPDSNQDIIKEDSTPVEQDLDERQGSQKGLFLRLQERLTKTRDSFVSRMDSLFLGRKEIDAELLDELEEILITADLGVNTALDLLDEIRKKVSRKELNDPQSLKFALKEKILSCFEGYDEAEMQWPAAGPFVIMVVGVNGVGKTTTIGKIANKFARAGQRVLLVAADTFRAAAIDQLRVWGERVGAEVVAKKQGDDPSSVIYDGLDYAATKDFDVIIIDTAGRLHTKVNLMEELKKIKRVINKKIEGAPHEVMLILDATTGQNSISQARLFNDAVDLTGLTLTKLDGTAKGGIVVHISHDFNIPIRFIGIGEKLEDLRDFDPGEFVEALFANGSRQ